MAQKNGQFKPGESGNPKGRPKGRANKITKELRAVLKVVVFDELERLPETLEGLEPEKRAELLTKLLPYVMPKIQQANYGFDEPIDTGWGF
jgi:hypothetical protein